MSTETSLHKDDTSSRKSEAGAESNEKVSEDIKVTVDSKDTTETNGGVIIYKLYRRRWIGLAGLAILNMLSGMNGQYFGSIGVDTSERFGITLNQVNWLSNIGNLFYLPAAVVVGLLLKKIGIRGTTMLGSSTLLIGSWLRYAATAKSLSSTGAYVLLLFSQTFIAVAQVSVQVTCVKFSEVWFDLRGRTTSTLITALSNPLGSALNGLIIPNFNTVNKSILFGGILATAIAPACFLVQEKPPHPPTFAGSRTSPPLIHTLRTMIGKTPASDPFFMSRRDRFDFLNLVFAFGILTAAIGTFSNFLSQIFEPHGYTAKTSGLFGATMLLSGIITSLVLGPVFDRILAVHMSLALRILLPIVGACWIGNIWNFKPNNAPGIFAVLAFVGACSFILLPVGLELGAEVTRNAETSATILWFSMNFMSFFYIIIEDALRAGPDASPPNHMTKSLIFNGTTIAFAAATMVLFFRGKQKRRMLDLEKLKEAKEIGEEMPGRASVQVPIPAS